MRALHRLKHCLQSNNTKQPFLLVSGVAPNQLVFCGMPHGAGRWTLTFQPDVDGRGADFFIDSKANKIHMDIHSMHFGVNILDWDEQHSRVLTQTGASVQFAQGKLIQGLAFDNLQEMEQWLLMCGCKRNAPLGSIGLPPPTTMTGMEF